jgi:hypothetical protein
VISFIHVVARNIDKSAAKGAADKCDVGGTDNVRFDAGFGCLFDLAIVSDSRRMNDNVGRIATDFAPDRHRITNIQAVV